MSDEWVSTPRLPITGEELAVIDKVIDKMAADFRRAGLEFKSIREIAENSPRWTAIDKIIAEGVDTLRSAIKVDFVEKLAERMVDRSSDDDRLCSINIVGYRMINTLMMVVAVTGKFRGKTRVPSYDKAYATAELKRRGLWKK